jgi:hypothetical protein
MKHEDEVARLMARAAEDESAKLAYARALRRHVLWFPVAHHPELPDPWEPHSQDVIPFWIMGDEEGPFSPVFSSPKLMRLALRDVSPRHSRARMPGADLFAVLARTGRRVKVNVGAKIRGTLGPEAVAEIAAGAEFGSVEHRGGTHASAKMDILPPEAWPEEWRGRLKEECEARGGILAVWLGRAKEGSIGTTVGVLHVMMLVEKPGHTSVDGVRQAACLAFPGQKIEFVPFDTKTGAETWAVLKQFATVYPWVGA